MLSVAVAFSLAASGAGATVLNLNPSTTAPFASTNTVNTIVARNGVVDATTTVATSNAVGITAGASTVYLGRTTGYNIRLTLGAGKFDSTPNATVAGTALGASVSVAGGGANTNTVTFAVTPATGGVTQGDGINIAAGQIVLKDVATLGTAGNSVGITVQVFDPVGGNQLGSDLTGTLFQSKEGWTVTFTGPSGTSGFGTAQRVDVGADSGKKEFSKTGVVNASADNLLFQTGRIQVATATGINNLLGLDATAANGVLTVTGSNFAPFNNTTNPDRIFLAAADCTASTSRLNVATGNASATFATSPTSVTNGTGYLCFQADGTSTIAAQSIGATYVVRQTGKLDSATFTEADEFLNMSFNGIVKTVTSFNPSSNASVDSLLRIVNTSSTPGLFTIDGTCPDGTAMTRTTFTLNGNNASVQYSSGELQGTIAVPTSKPALSASMGSCTAAGRLRLTITGEVGTAEVQNFLRSNINGATVTAGNNNEN